MSAAPEREQGAGCDLLLRGGTVVTMDDRRRLIEDGAVAIAGGRIVAVGSAAELAATPAARVVECGGKAVMPGLIDSHTHLYQGLARSLGEGMRLWSWLSEFMWPYAAAMEREDALAAARLGAVEAIRNGTTAILDHHYAPSDLETTLAVAAAIESVGLRGVVARGLAGKPSQIAGENALAGELFSRSNEEELEICRQCFAARPPGTRVAIWPAPHNVTYADQDLLRGAVALAREAGSGWHSHCCSTIGDPGVYRSAYGVTPVAWLDREGLLGAGATLAHGIHLSDEEVGMLGATGSAIAHCPVSNGYGADGVIRLRELRDAGATVALGSDGPAYNHRQDLFECMQEAVLVQRMHRLDPTASDSGEALELATRQGARLLGLDAGVLAPGKLADLAVVDLAAPHLTPHHDLGAALVYSARGSDVAMTVVGGEIVYENGRCTSVDEEAVVAEARERAAALVQRAGVLRRP